MFNQNYPFSSYPFAPNVEDVSNAKLSEDRYEVYVNGEFTGYKTLKAQGERLSDIDSFLRAQGMTSFSTILEGDHYNIQTDEQADDLTKALQVYFENR